AAGSPLFPYTTLFRSRLTLLLAEVVELHDVRVIEGHRDLDLALEHLQELVVGAVAGLDAFDAKQPRGALRGRQARSVDLRHSPRSEEHTSELQSLRHL